MVAPPARHASRDIPSHRHHDDAQAVSAPTLDYLRKTFVGTTIGRQEIEGELLGGNPGALWTDKTIEASRVRSAPEPLKRIVVAIDPSANQGNQDACECGIVVAGLGWDQNVYVLEDLSGHYSPLQWVKEAWEAYVSHDADRIVYEANLGGAMVETTFRLQHPAAPLKPVYASKGKATRAEPVSALYERGMVHHVGMHKELEDQLTTWVPGKKSPDRLDALVWAVTELALNVYELDDQHILDANNRDIMPRSFSL